MPLFQTGNQRGSFLTRNTATLDKLAAMTKTKTESRSGSGAKNTNKFVFAALSPSKGQQSDIPVAEEGAGSPVEGKKQKRKSAASSSEALKAKKVARVDRTLDENSRDTVFGHL